DAYEYLIGMFAAGAGKKAGEFYTPQAVSRIMSEITSIGQESRAPFHIYDSKTITMIQIQSAGKRLQLGVL
ncbi:SAM-dependent methyltransferase, partial [Salmonella enterica]|nr:SAM-dependent methyltransferase [Salmonella enterica]